MAFTKFDSLVVQEYSKLDDVQDDEGRWAQAEENAEKTFQEVYLSKVLNTKFPPKAYACLQGENHESHLIHVRWIKPLVNRYGYARDALF
jgi:hypothetical protein